MLPASQDTDSFRRRAKMLRRGEEEGPPIDLPRDAFGEVVIMLFEFLASKSLATTARALRDEVEQMLSNASPLGVSTPKWQDEVGSHNSWTSRLEDRLALISATLEHREPCPEKDEEDLLLDENVMDVTPHLAASLSEPSIAVSASLCQSRPSGLLGCTAICTSG